MPDAEYLALPQFLRWMMAKYTQIKTADLQLPKPAATTTVKQADVQLSTFSRSVEIKPA
jgi:hypothetical protein